MMSRLTVFLIIVLLGETAYFLYHETNDLVVKNQVIRDGVLARQLGRARVVHVSDLHVGTIGVREKKLIGIVAEADPDIIFVTGDLVAGNSGIMPCARMMAEVGRGRTVIAILGNNDHTYRDNVVDTGLLVSELERSGVIVLRNESLKITAGNVSGGVYIVGLDDNFLWLDDIFRALTNVPAGAPKILLAHAPFIVEKINTDGINLVLSGHTHGGQILLPYIGALYTNPGHRAAKRYVSGLYRDGTLLYVNRGIGMAMIPLRLFCKPEVTILEFRER